MSIRLIPLVALTLAVPALAAPVPAMPVGDAARGAQIYEGQCGACHSLDSNRVGPAHRGVFGRHAGRAPGYDYSAAVKRSAVVWTAANLNRWLSGPSKMIPGTKMGFSLTDAQKRADVIAYLKQQSAPAKH